MDQMTVMSSQWPPPTSTPLFFGLWKSICGFEIDALVRWDYYYSSYWSRILKTAWRVVTTFEFCGLFITRQFVILLSRSTMIREKHSSCVFELRRKFKTYVISPPKPQWLQTLLLKSHQLVLQDEKEALEDYFWHSPFGLWRPKSSVEKALKSRKSWLQTPSQTQISVEQVL